MFRVLDVNIGSTSFKFQLFEMENESVLAKGLIERVGYQQSPLEYSVKTKDAMSRLVDTSSGYDSCIKSMTDLLLDKEEGVIERMSEINAIGFKTAHGGEIRKPSLITNEVIRTMGEYSPVVPAHNPPYINFFVFI